MKKQKQLKAALSMAMAMAALSSPAAMAGEPGWYVGADLGTARSNVDDERINGGLLAQGFTSTAITDNDHALAFKAFGGYQFNRYFALEGGYFNLGKYGFTATTTPPGTLTGSAKFQGANLDAVGILPLTDKWSAFARAGVLYTDSKASFSGSGTVQVADPDRSKNSASYKFGGGLQYDITPRLGLRAEVERYRLDDTIGNKGDVDVASLGVVYRFAAAPAHTAAVEPIAAAPAPSLPPAPPAPEAAVEQPQRLTLSADSYFDFDRAALRPAARATLDQFATGLSGSRYDRITVTGHTDRLGSEAHNQTLSAQRADAVKGYLVDTAGIAASKISATGVSGSAPATKPDQCTQQFGIKVSLKLIACLQPDRRVEVEVDAVTPAN